MDNSQNYIGVPNGVVFCVDMVREYALEGRFYHAYSTEATEVSSLHDLCLKHDFLMSFSIRTRGRIADLFSMKKVRRRSRRSPGGKRDCRGGQEL